VHYLPHQLLDHVLADEAILLARQFCDCLRNRVDHLIGFIGIDFVRPGCRGVFGEEAVDQGRSWSSRSRDIECPHFGERPSAWRKPRLKSFILRPSGQSRKCTDAPRRI
jgi:hypothetical protein